MEETYFVSEGQIIFSNGVKPQLQRAGSFIANNGSFKPARFERRDAQAPAPSPSTGGKSKKPKTPTESAYWSFKNNEFVGTREFSGLAVMNSIVANWDTKDTNNKIVSFDGVTPFYIIGDYGGTLGKMGGWLSTINSVSKITRVILLWLLVSLVQQ